MAEMIARLKVDSSEYDVKIQRAARGIQDLARTCHEAGGMLNVLEDENREYIQSLGSMQTVAQTARGKIAELTSAFIDIKSVYNSLSEEEKNGEFGKELNRQLDIMKGRIQEGKNELASINNEISGGGGLTDSLDALAGKFGLSIKSLTGWGAALGAGTAALKVAKDVFNDSESNIDEWGRTVKSAEASYDVFVKTLNNGNWSNFFDNLNTAIKGARDLYDALDRLGSVKSNNEAAIVITQQSIAQLRLRKQQGENVDKQLKEATDRLAALQRQGVEAGKTAGRTIIGETLKNTYNTQDGAGQLGQRTVDRVTTELLKGGQQVFDRYKTIYQNLAKKAEDTRIVSIGTTSAGTSAGSYEQRYVNLEKLTNEERKQYLLAKSVTESETQLQQGIHAYAQAVSEATSSAREEFKGNRYALQGGGSGGGKGGSTVKTDTTITGSIDEQTKKVQELQKAWRAAADDDSRLKIKKEIEKQQYILDRMTGKETFDPSKMTALKGKSIVPEIKLEDPLKRAQETLKTTRVEIEAEIKADATKVDTATLHTLLKDAIQSGIDDGLMNFTFASIGDQIAQGINVPDEAWQKILDQYNALREQIGLEPISLDFKTGSIDSSTKEKGGSSLESSQKLVSGLSSVSSGLQQMGVKIPDGVQKLMGGIQGLMTVIQGVQSIISIFNTSTATAQTLTTNTNTAAMTALTSAVIANTAAITTNTITPSFFSGGGVVHAASGYVGGSHFSGDLVPALLNSGELVLNQAQQGNIASQLQAASMINGGGGGGHDYVSGQNIYLGTNNYLKGSGQGQLVTTRMLRQYGLIN